MDKGFKLVEEKLTVPKEKSHSHTVEKKELSKKTKMK